jgi:hypothetical protein
MVFMLLPAIPQLYIKLWVTWSQMSSLCLSDRYERKARQKWLFSIKWLIAFQAMHLFISLLSTTLRSWIVLPSGL